MFKAQCFVSNNCAISYLLGCFLGSYTCCTYLLNYFFFVIVRFEHKLTVFFFCERLSLFLPNSRNRKQTKDVVILIIQEFSEVFSRNL